MMISVDFRENQSDFMALTMALWHYGTMALGFDDDSMALIMGHNYIRI